MSPMAQYPWDIVEMSTYTDAAGSATQAEVGREVPFQIRHLYWLHDVALLTGYDGGYATFHANHLLIPLAGGCEVRLSDGITHRTVALEGKPYHQKVMGLWCKPGAWRELVSPEAGTILLVLCDKSYEDSQYVRDWPTFLHKVGKTRG